MHYVEVNTEKWMGCNISYPGLPGKGGGGGGDRWCIALLLLICLEWFAAELERQLDEMKKAFSDAQAALVGLPFSQLFFSAT